MRYVDLIVKFRLKSFSVFCTCETMLHLSLCSVDNEYNRHSETSTSTDCSISEIFETLLSLQNKAWCLLQFNAMDKEQIEGMIKEHNESRI